MRTLPGRLHLSRCVCSRDFLSYCSAGGDICWPSPGFWNANQHSVPGPCPNPNACPGFVSTSPSLTIAYTQVGSRVLHWVSVSVQLCLRAFQGIACLTDPSTHERLLVQDTSLQCYSGFPATFGFICVLIAVYGVGFPALCAYVLYRGVSKSRTPKSSQSEPAPPHVESASTDQQPSTSASHGPQPIARDVSVRYGELHNEKRFSKYAFLHRGVKVVNCDVAFGLRCCRIATGSFG